MDHPVTSRASCVKLKAGANEGSDMRGKYRVFTVDGIGFIVLTPLMHAYATVSGITYRQVMDFPLIDELIVPELPKRPITALSLSIQPSDKYNEPCFAHIPVVSITPFVSASLYYSKHNTVSSLRRACYGQLDVKSVVCAFNATSSAA
jgi:hypothetical protein